MPWRFSVCSPFGGWLYCEVPACDSPCLTLERLRRDDPLWGTKQVKVRPIREEQMLTEKFGFLKKDGLRIFAGT